MDIPRYVYRMRDFVLKITSEINKLKIQMDTFSIWKDLMTYKRT